MVTRFHLFRVIKRKGNLGSGDFWIVKTNDAGSIQWQKTLGGSGMDIFASIQQLADGSYIMGGYSASNISGNKTENSKGEEDFWIIKTQ